LIAQRPHHVLAAGIEIAKVEDDILVPEAAGGIVDRVPPVEAAIDIERRAVTVERVFEDA
jgi:hypothetical protein